MNMPSITITLSPHQADELKRFLEEINIIHVESVVEPSDFQFAINMCGPYGNSGAVTCGQNTLLLGELEVNMDLAY